MKNLSKVGKPEVMVDLKNPQCCSYVRDYKLPCRHVLVVLLKTGMWTPATQEQTMKNFWPPQFNARSYYGAYQHQRVILPMIKQGRFQGPVADKILRPGTYAPHVYQPFHAPHA